MMWCNGLAYFWLLHATEETVWPLTSVCWSKLGTCLLVINDICHQTCTCCKMAMDNGTSFLFSSRGRLVLFTVAWWLLFRVAALQRPQRLLAGQQNPPASSSSRIHGVGS